jgi:16S rRNA (uracil1498-N3)-methyltransferase
MTSHRVYVEDECLLKSKVTLSSVASYHLIKSLRCNVGDKIILFNGTDYEHMAEIVSISHQELVVFVLEKNHSCSESPLKIHLFQAISRGNRMDYAIQKAVECGVCSITPMMTERTNIKLSEDRARKRVTHWQAIALHAAQQSGRLIVPEINPVCNFNNIEWQPGQLYFIAHPEIDSGLSQSDIGSQCALVIGPEGGFSYSEITVANKLKFKGINLGPRILRTETAPVVALTLLQSCYGDL